MTQSSVFDSPCSSISCRSPEKQDSLFQVNEENDIKVEDDSSTNSHQTEECLFIFELIKNLPDRSEILVVKPGRSVRETVTCEEYNNLKETYIIKVQAQTNLPTPVTITKRQIFSKEPCHSTTIPIRVRILNRSNSQVGFIFQRPSKETNDNRYLVLYDDFSAAYHRLSNFHLCLCQDFRRHLLNIEYELLRSHYRQCFQRISNVSTKHFQINQIIRVKKFDGNFHQARIIEIDRSLLKICFFQRKSQKQMWIYENSTTIIDQTNESINKEMSPPLNEPISLRKRKEPIDFQDKQKRTRTASNNVAEKSTNSILTIDFSHGNEETSRTNFYTNFLLPKFRQLNSLVFNVHKCSRDCVFSAEENILKMKIRSNPFLLPFECRWSIVESLPRGYRTPCRRTLFSLDEIEQYLYRVESKLSIKFFVDAVLNRFQPLIENFDRKYLFDNDLSQGKENLPISVYNDVDDDRPDKFTYITEIRPIDQRILSTFYDQTRTSCCDCLDNCSDRTKCACFLKTLGQARLNKDPLIVGKDKNRISDALILKTVAYQRKRLFNSISSGIYECNSKCSCHREHCSNRLVQHGLFVQLQLFKDQQKGWGLRALHDIPRGTFICQYIGELLTSDQGHERALTMEDKYQTNLDLVKQVCNGTDDLVDVEPYVIDGSIYSNLGRYFNHSCAPNMFIQNVFIDSHNLLFPNLALFTSTHVKAGEELTWDYNYELLPEREVKCFCSAKNCRGRLL